MRTFDCSDPTQRALGLQRAAAAIREGRLVVTPTDTVYGIAADAFNPEAVNELLLAKGRRRSMPPPVLIGHPRTVDGIATQISDAARALMDAFWPGALTVILMAQPSLDWDLGDTFGTVAARMPNDELTLDFLAATGPLAVSSANRTTQPAATDAEQAREQLGDLVSIYLDGGPSSSDQPSTIIDATRGQLRVVRAGAISLEALREVAPQVLGPDDPGPEAGAESPTGIAAELATEPASGQAPA